MEFAAEKEGTPGGGLPRVLEGARPSPELGEGARDLAGSPEAGGGEERDGPPGMKKTGHTEGIKMDLTVVKQEAVDWSDVDGDLLDGRCIKQEAEDEPDMKDEQAGILQVKREVDSGVVIKEEKVDEPEVKEEEVKVKEEVMDWVDVKEYDQQGNLMKQELFVHQTIKEEQVMDGVGVKEEKDFLKTEAMEHKKVKEEPQMNPPVGSKRKLAMSRCETCGTEEAKYRCPRCMRCSCSLPCVKKHKAELTCSGVRDKTAYVSIQQFTEMNLLSDYRFLEDVARTADHISRDTSLKRPANSKHMHFMKNRARKQGINLKLLPGGFTKRKENSTYFDKRRQQFFWHVKLQFPQSQAEYIEKRVPGDKTLNEILKPYTDPEQSDPVIRQRLKAYVHSQTGVQILMKAENMQQSFISFGNPEQSSADLILNTKRYKILETVQKITKKLKSLSNIPLFTRYHELDPSKSLSDNLRNKVIIEYPTLHIVLKGACGNMKVLHQVKSESTKNFGNEH